MLKDGRKIRMTVERCMSGSVHVMGPSETYLNSPGAGECRRGSKGSLQGSMDGGAVDNVEESIKGRSQEGCAILISSDIIWKCVTEYGWRGTKIV